jgi:hypothetical protein
MFCRTLGGLRNAPQSVLFRDAGDLNSGTRDEGVFIDVECRPTALILDVGSQADER